MSEVRIKAADSPRWCATCAAWGDHHTDRHDAMTAAPTGPEPRTDAAVPTEEQLAEYTRLAELAIDIQHAYQRGYEAGRAACRCTDAAVGR